MEEFLSFRKMITPVVIQAIFWVGCAVAVLMAFATMFRGGWYVIVGLVQLIAGPLFVRIWCELIMLGFRVYEEMVIIRTALAPGATGTPPISYGLPQTPFTTDTSIPLTPPGPPGSTTPL